MLQIRRNVLRIARGINAQIYLGHPALRVDKERVALRKLEQAKIAQGAVSLRNFAFTIGKECERQIVFARKGGVTFAVIDTYAAHRRPERFKLAHSVPVSGRLFSAARCVVARIEIKYQPLT